MRLQQKILKQIISREIRRFFNEGRDYYLLKGETALKEFLLVDFFFLVTYQNQFNNQKHVIYGPNVEQSSSRFWITDQAMEQFDVLEENVIKS